MALIEIHGLPINSMVIFHGELLNNQMVNDINGGFSSKSYYQRVSHLMFFLVPVWFGHCMVYVHIYIPICFSGSSAINIKISDFDSSGNATSPRWGGGTWGRFGFFEFQRPKVRSIETPQTMADHFFKTITVSGYSMLKEKPIPHFFVDVKSMSSEDSMVQFPMTAIPCPFSRSWRE